LTHMKSMCLRLAHWDTPTVTEPYLLVTQTHKHTNVT